MMTIMPHNHSMWAVIGIYKGREDNIFWRRLPDGSGKVEAAGAGALCVGDATPLGHDIIHSVTNPIPRLTGAIHVYGGDFFDPHTGVNGTPKPVWPFAALKRQMQFLRTDSDAKDNNRTSALAHSHAHGPDRASAWS
jgi:predicted metal-dependent enzyme (double-stranded beta helix superfamily)